MAWIFAARIAEVPQRGARVLRVGGESIGVFRTSSDEVFAVRDRCPHKGGPLSQGIVHGSCVTCPLHDWVIDLTTGRATGPDEGSTQCFPVRIEGDLIYVDVAGYDLAIEQAPVPLAAARA